MMQQTSSTSTQWNSKQVQSLIKAVKHTSYIYDVRDKKNLNVADIEIGWEIISKFIKNGSNSHIPASECRYKWDQLVNQLKRIEQSRKLSNSKPNWVYYENMSFLIPIISGSKLEIPAPSKEPLPSSPESKRPRLSNEYAGTVVKPCTSSASHTKQPASSEVPIETEPVIKPTGQPLIQVKEEPSAATELSQYLTPNGEVEKETALSSSEITSSTAKNILFFKVLSDEMKKLSEKEQSKYRISILSQLHDLIYLESDKK